MIANKVWTNGKRAIDKQKELTLNKCFTLRRFQHIYDNRLIRKDKDDGKLKCKMV